MRATYRNIILTCLLLFVALSSNAAKFSYVYIQGDKETPFYVKLEDEMLPRYGKNYSIISRLAPGPIHIKILFQQNVYPVQSFTILVPENGNRGFILTKKGDQFSLYDIQQQFYLMSGNKEEEDRAPESKPDNEYISTKIGPKSDTIIRKEETIEPEIIEEPSTVSAPPAQQPVVEKQMNGPEFMDIELSKEHQAETDNTLPGGADKTHTTKNGGCSKAVDMELLSAIHKKATDKGDKARLKYLLVKAEENCFTTNQVKTLTKTLSNDPERYTFLKKVYPKVTDQAQFHLLGSLLTTEEWKSYFKLIIQ